MDLRFPESLSTGRLLLRRLQDDDALALCGYRSLPEVARYQSWDSFGLEDAGRLLNEQRGREVGVPGTWFQVAIVEAESGELIGDCGLRCLLEEPDQFEMGITLMPSRQGWVTLRRRWSVCWAFCSPGFLLTVFLRRRMF
jgi:RimJ/RimL family protein N-acetyltransferase